MNDVTVVAFSAAAQLGCTDMVRMLLDLGVPVNATDARGWTALHAASAAGHEDVMLLLLQSGVSTVRCALDNITQHSLLAIEPGHPEIQHTNIIQKCIIGFYDIVLGRPQCRKRRTIHAPAHRRKAASTRSHAGATDARR